MSEDGAGLAVEAFLDELETIPWFGRIGDPLDGDPSIDRLRRWEDWPGPKEPGVDELARRHQALYDAILADAGDERHQLLELWDRIHQVVLHAAASRVPYDPDQDCYHAPSTAVWFAIWTAGLVGWCLKTGRPIPEDLGEQWLWLRRGHWPAGYAWVDSAGQTGPLLVL